MAGMDGAALSSGAGELAFAGSSAAENDFKGSVSESERAVKSGSGHMAGMDGAAPSSGAGELAFAGSSAAENDFKGSVSESEPAAKSGFGHKTGMDGAAPSCLDAVIDADAIEVEGQMLGAATETVGITATVRGNSGSVVDRSLDVLDSRAIHSLSSVFARGSLGPVSSCCPSVCRSGRVLSGRGSALCPCCRLDLVGGNDNICGECLIRAGFGSWNSCVGHGEGLSAERVQEAAGETKSLSTCTRVGVGRPLNGTLSVGEELASDPRGASEEAGVWRPLDGLTPVGDELVSDLRGASWTVHVETREGRMNTNRCGTRLLELGQGCEVEVKIPTDPERNSRLSGPGISLSGKGGDGNPT